MPDDKITEEIAEQDKEEKEAMDAFDEDGGDSKGDNDNDDDEKEKDQKTPDDDSGDSDDDGDDDDDSDKDDDDTLSPKEIAEQRAGIKGKKKSKGDSNNPLLSFLYEDETDVDDLDSDNDKEKDKSKEKDEQKEKSSLDPGSDDFDLEEYAKAYPEDYSAMMKIVKIATDKIMSVKNPDEDIEYVTKEEFEYEKAQNSLEREVRRQHPDAESITAMDDSGNLLNKDFAEWINGQPKAIQRLFVHANKDIVNASEDFVAGMDYYKDCIRQKQADDHDDDARKSKKKKDDLHGNTMRSKKTKRKASNKSFEDEEAEAIKEFEKD